MEKSLASLIRIRIGWKISFSPGALFYFILFLFIGFRSPCLNSMFACYESDGCEEYLILIDNVLSLFPFWLSRLTVARHKIHSLGLLVGTDIIIKGVYFITLK